MTKISFALTGAFACALLSVHAQTAQTPKETRPAPERRIMAPPPETKLTPKLRPSTSESGLSRKSKPPLTELPAFGATWQGTASSAQRTGHWLLLYRNDQCVPCDGLMNALAASQSPDLREGVPYTVIVGGSSPAAATTVRSAYNTLNSATWVSDPDRKLYAALQLQGAPMLFGMNGNRVVWRQAGTLGDPQAALRRVDAWIAGTAAAAASKAKDDSKAPRATPAPATGASSTAASNNGITK